MGIDVELEKLLEPIPGDNPAGVDLRDDDDPNNIFRRIKDARNDARQEESQAELDGTSSPEAARIWSQVWSDGQEYLQSQAKDLEIAAYMIEASIRLGGYQGLATALEMTNELASRFWGELLPTPDEDGIETTILPIARLNGDVISSPLMRIPVTDDSSAGEMLVWQHAQAQQLEGLDADERDLLISRGAVTLEKFNQAVAETTSDFFLNLKSELDRTREILQTLERTFEEKAGDEFAPNLSRFEKSIAEAEAVLEQVAGDKLIVEEEEIADEDSGATDGGGGAVGGVGSAPKKEGITSREDAFSQLEKIATWIQKNEPQSLLPSEIRKVIKRGKMSPQELYEDLITDDTARRELYRDVGIDVPESDGY